MTSFSIHTFEIQKKIDWQTKRGATSVLFKEAKQKNFQIYEVKNYVYCKKYTSQGVFLTLGTKLQGKYPYHFLNLRVNPRRLLGDTSYVGLFDLTENNIISLIERLNKLIKSIGYTFDIADLNLFSFERLDLCHNIHLGSPVEADLYMKLIKRANIPEGFVLNTKYDAIAKRQKPYENAFELEGFSLKLVVYNKQRQMETNPFYDVSSIKEAESVLRYEVSLKQQLARYYKNKTVNVEKFFSLLRQVSITLLLKYCRKGFTEGDYYSLDKARVLIQASSYSREKKFALIMILETTNRMRSYALALLHCREELELSKKEMKKLTRCFDCLRLNPVTIPSRWEIDFLPGLYSLLKKQIVDMDATLNG